MNVTNDMAEAALDALDDACIGFNRSNPRASVHWKGFTRDDRVAAMRTALSAALAKQDAAIALMRGQSEPAACAHENTDTHYDCVTCRDCGGFRADSGWGIAKNRWFASRDEASFYQKNGRLPSKPEGHSR